MGESRIEMGRLAVNFGGQFKNVRVNLFSAYCWMAKQLDGSIVISNWVLKGKEYSQSTCTFTS